MMQHGSVRFIVVLASLLFVLPSSCSQKEDTSSRNTKAAAPVERRSPAIPENDEILESSGEEDSGLSDETILKASGLPPEDLKQQNSTAAQKAQPLSQTQKDLSDIISRFVSTESDKQLQPLHSAVIIFPLVNGNGETSSLGTVLSVLGMIKATYTPKATFNLQVPDVIDLYNDKHYADAGRTISVKDRERAIAQSNARDWANGTLEINDGGAFRIELNFEGANGKKTFSKTGKGKDLLEVPPWMAYCIFEYCRMELAPEQKACIEQAEFQDVDSLLTLSKLESDYCNYRWNFPQWKALLQANPYSPFILYRYCILSEYAKQQGEGLGYVNNGLEFLGGNDFLKFLQARYYHQSRDYSASIPLFLQLIDGDFQNDALYWWVHTALIESDIGDSMLPLYSLYKSRAPESHLPFLEEGTYYERAARKVRGDSWSYKVPKEAFKQEENLLRLAAQDLTRAYEMAPADPRAAVEMISVAQGLNLRRAQMKEWFTRAVEADPTNYSPYKQKLYFLSPFHNGSYQQLMAFARECAAAPPKGSRVGLILADAHWEMASHLKDFGEHREQYYKDPYVWNELKAVYQAYLAEHPNSPWDRNYFAYYAVLAGDSAEAARQFEMIGQDYENRCWGSKEFFDKSRSWAYSLERLRKSTIPHSQD